MNNRATYQMNPTEQRKYDEKMKRISHSCTIIRQQATYFNAIGKQSKAFLIYGILHRCLKKVMDKGLTIPIATFITPPHTNWLKLVYYGNVFQFCIKKKDVKRKYASLPIETPPPKEIIPIPSEPPYPKEIFAEAYKIVQQYTFHNAPHTPIAVS